MKHNDNNYCIYFENYVNLCIDAIFNNPGVHDGGGVVADGRDVTAATTTDLDTDHRGNQTPTYPSDSNQRPKETQNPAKGNSESPVPSSQETGTVQPG